MRLAVELDVAARRAASATRSGWRGAAARCTRAINSRHRERLDHVVVGAGGEAAHALALLAARGQHDDRQPLGFGPRAQPAAQLDAGEAGQHPVEHQQVGHAFLQLHSRPRRRAATVSTW